MDPDRKSSKGAERRGRAGQNPHGDGSDRGALLKPHLGERKRGGVHDFEELLPQEFVAVKIGSQDMPPRGMQRMMHSSPIPVQTMNAFSALPGDVRQTASQFLYSNDSIWGSPTTSQSSHSSQAQYIQAWETKVDMWFAEADVDGDGRVAGDEASAFFRRSGVNDELLSEMWRIASEGQDGLNRASFSTALKLVAILQKGSRLSTDVVTTAKAQPFPHRWPTISSMDSPPDDSMRVQSSEASGSYSSSPISRSSRPGSPYGAHSMLTSPPPPSWILAGMDSNPSTHSPNGVDSTTPRPNSICLDTIESGELPDDFGGGSLFCAACLVSAEIRLPPLHPKQSAKLKLAVGVKGSLIAAPSMNGGLLQWVNVRDGMNVTGGDGGRSASTEDKDSARCLEIPSEPGATILSTVVHEDLGYLWTGHDNGVVSLYAISNEPHGLSQRVFYWKAHKYSGVAAMCVTSWGELWTGSTRGTLRVWSDAISPNHPKTGRTLKRSDHENAHGEIQAIVVSACGSIVWTAGQNNICLWAAYGGHFLGRIQTDKFVDGENDERNIRINTRQGLEQTSTGKLRGIPKFGDRVQSDPEESEQDGMRLRDAVGQVARILGKGVRKAGEKVLARNQQQPPAYVNEDAIPSKFGSIKGMLALPDNTIWVAYKNGFLERYTYYGRFTTRLNLRSPLTCIGRIGDRMWVGLADGWVVVISHQAKELKRWLAHEEPVCSFVAMGPLAFTLATDGSIKCWSSRIPDRTDAKAWQALNEALPGFIEKESISVLCGTWNVNETRPQPESLRKWLGGRRRVGIADIVIIGLQEIEMGTSSVAKNFVLDAVAKGSSRQEKGNSNAQWWSNEIHEALEHEEDPTDRGQKWEKIGMRQMSGIMIYAFARSKFHPYIGSMSSSSVGTGVMGFGGNKGAVAITFTLYRRRVVVVCSHFAAHQDGVEKRNQDYASIVRQLTFHKHNVVKDAPPTPPPGNQRGPGVSSMQLQRTALSSADVRRSTSERSQELDEEEVGLSKGLQRADLLIWVGDFNYRVDMSYLEAKEAIEQNRLPDMLEKDQCRKEMNKNRVFRGLREGDIKFQPTYKFDKGNLGPYAYDSSEKQRVPSWTDRIFYRGSKPFSTAETASSSKLMSQLSGPLDSLLDIDSGNGTNKETSPSTPDADEILVECMGYNAVITVTDSDHKPVWGLLRVAYPTYKQHKRRQTCYEILRNAVWNEQPQISLELSSTNLMFRGDGSQEVFVTNTCKERILVTISWDKSHRQMPKWLEILPQQFILTPGSKTRVSVTTAQAASGFGYLPHRLYANLVAKGVPVMGVWNDNCQEYGIEVVLRSS